MTELEQIFQKYRDMLPCESEIAKFGEYDGYNVYSVKLHTDTPLFIGLPMVVLEKEDVYKIADNDLADKIIASF